MLDINALKNFGKVQKYLKGMYLFQQGDPGADMYIILAGKVSVLISGAVGDNIQVAELSAGNFVGEMSVLEGQSRSATVVVLEDAVTLSIDQANFVKFIASKPEWAFKIMQALSNRLRKVNEKLTATQFKEEDIQKGVDKFIPNPSTTTSAIFPDGHSTYGIQVPGEYSEYLYDRKMACPVCQSEFTGQVMRTSRLRLVTTEKDFRERHENFDKLWYNIWVCPSCYYASFTSDFLSIEKRPAAKLEPLLMEFAKNNHFKIDNHITDIDQVFLFYYLALNTRKLMKKVDFKVGKLWLNMAWLYQDVNDEKMFNLAYKTSMENYSYVLYNSHVDVVPQEEQKLFMLLGEMYLKENNAQEALKCYQRALSRDGKGMLADDARNRIHDTRELIKSKSAESPGADAADASQDSGKPA